MSFILRCIWGLGGLDALLCQLTIVLISGSPIIWGIMCFPHKLTRINSEHYLLFGAGLSQWCGFYENMGLAFLWETCFMEYMRGNSSLLPLFFKIFGNMPLFQNYLGPCPCFNEELDWFKIELCWIKLKEKKKWNLSSI